MSEREARVTQPTTEAGRDMLAAAHEPKGPCWDSPLCEHGTLILAIEREAGLIDVVRLREALHAADPRRYAECYHGLTESDCGIDAEDIAREYAALRADRPPEPPTPHPEWTRGWNDAFASIEDQVDIVKPPTGEEHCCNDPEHMSAEYLNHVYAPDNAVRDYNGAAVTNCPACGRTDDLAAAHPCRKYGCLIDFEGWRGDLTALDAEIARREQAGGASANAMQLGEMTGLRLARGLLGASPPPPDLSELREALEWIEQRGSHSGVIPCPQDFTYYLQPIREKARAALASQPPSTSREPE